MGKTLTITSEDGKIIHVAREWRPVNEENQRGTWTTRDPEEVARARKEYPWIKFQVRFMSDWIAE